MKCPFRKTTNYVAYQNTGEGYPVEWITNEEFENCIGEECAAFGKAPTYIWDREDEVTTFCCLCHSGCQKEKKRIFSDEFMLKLP